MDKMEVDFGGHLDYLTDEMCQINTWVSCIARWHARLGGFAASPSPSPEALADEDDDAGDDVDENACFPVMTRWWPLSDLPSVTRDKKEE